MIRGLLYSIGVSFFIICLWCGWVLVQLVSPVTVRSGEVSQHIIVRKGAVYADVYEQLSSAIQLPPFVPTALIPKLYAVWKKRSLQRGMFEITPETRLIEALLMVYHRGQAQMVKVTLPEGLSLDRTADILSDKLGIRTKQFLSLAQNDSLLRVRDIQAKSIEGYVAPNTYMIYKGAGVEEVLDILLDEHTKVWQSLPSKKTPLNLTKHEVLTLASIVEAETPNDDEKPRVAGVYVNRLKIGMKLDADPTVQYALGSVKRRLYYKDLEVDNPYNTYRYKGLPPGPINSPGKAAIQAALNPEQHSYLYFVALGDGSQRHTFSATAQEHERAVALYRKRRAE